MNEKLLNMSSSPHVRHSLTTGSVMTDVVLALLPATVFGIYRYGLHAFLVILISVASAVLAEYLFDLVAKHPNTIRVPSSPDFYSRFPFHRRFRCTSRASVLSLRSFS